MIDRRPWQTAAAAVALALIVLAGVRLVEGGPAPREQVSLASPPATGGDRAHAAATWGGSGGAGSAERPRILVHVAGAVRRPGVYTLPRGARGAVALERAGGPAARADVAGVNLAAVLQDGQQLIVPVRGARPLAPAASAAPSAAAGPSAAAPISLGSATVAELEQLDGIGPALAARIVAYRERHGGFRSVDELREVDGIGAKRLAALRDAVRP